MVFYRRNLVQHPDEFRSFVQDLLLAYGIVSHACLAVDYIPRLLFSSGCWLKVSGEQVGLNLLEITIG